MSDAVFRRAEQLAAHSTPPSVDTIGPRLEAFKLAREGVRLVKATVA